MFQSFEVTSRPADGIPRLAALREAMAAAGLDGVLIPRADLHQGEYVAPCDERLAWLTGFTGSAGLAVVLAERAGLFADGRYTVQARQQAPEAYEIVPWPTTRPGVWAARHLPKGARFGIDPWLATLAEHEALARDMPGIEIVETPSLVDQIWTDRPAPPSAPAYAYPTEFAGQTAADKRAAIASALGAKAAILTLPDSIAWLLNIRGSDIARIPICQALAIVQDDAQVTLFADPAKFDGVREHLGDVTLRPSEAFAEALAALPGPVRVDRSTAPLAVTRLLGETEILYGDDPCLLPKATKNTTELDGAREAHLRDGAAMAEFLAWLTRTAPEGGLTEIDVVRELEGYRRATGALRDISFDTISGTGPHGAIVHYRVTESTNRPIRSGDLLLVDSGGQYLDGTTDVTRTLAIGPASPETRAAYTRVLRGMIAISRLRFPKGLAGRDIDALARAPLWAAGQDFDHGTGHGVGHFLSVHEGPQRISRRGETPFQPGMIVSNEPGYYREGAFGIRIENLLAVQTAPELAGGNPRAMLSFETLTWVPLDRALIDTAALTSDERAWIDAYHAETLAKIAPRLSADAAEWMARACRPL